MVPLMLWATAAVFIVLAFVVWRRWVAPWRQLVELITALAESRSPRGYLIAGNRLARRAGLLLEKLQAHYSQLETQAAADEFSVRTILAAMPDGLAVVDEQRQVRLTNPRFRELFGAPDAHPDDTLLEAIRDVETEACVYKTIEDGESCVATMRLLRSGSEPRDLEVKAEPIRENGRDVRGAVVLFRDVTETNRAEQVRRDFVANVSHELRTPLSIFRGYLETLLAHPKQPPRELLRIFETMEKHSNRLTMLVEDVLTLSQLEAPEARLHLERMRLDHCLAAIGRDWTSPLAAKHLTLEVDAPPSLPPIIADETRIQEIVYNLLDNAVKYTPEGGRIVLRARPEGNEYVLLSVEDTGSGIPQRDLPRIFERFYRADKARSQQISGTGLGLSIVKHIVHLHGGKVEVASELGKGTTIIVRLPVNGPEVKRVTEMLH